MEAANRRSRPSTPSTSSTGGSAAADGAAVDVIRSRAKAGFPSGKRRISTFAPAGRANSSRASVLSPSRSARIKASPATQYSIAGPSTCRSRQPGVFRWSRAENLGRGQPGGGVDVVAELPGEAVQGQPLPEPLAAGLLPLEDGVQQAGGDPEQDRGRGDGHQHFDQRESASVVHVPLFAVSPGRLRPASFRYRQATSRARRSAAPGGVGRWTTIVSCLASGSPAGWTISISILQSGRS